MGVRLLGMLAAAAVTLLAALVARHLAGSRAGYCAAAVTGVVLGSPAIDGDRTSGELLAAVPTTAAIAILVWTAARDRRGTDALVGARRSTILALAGAAAAAGPLIKQSALDACVVAACWCAWRAWSLRSTRAGRGRLGLDAASFAAGLSVLAGTTALLALRSGASWNELEYALFGFRFDVLDALQHQSTPPIERARRLLEPGLASGLLPLALLAPIGAAIARRGQVGASGAVMLCGWLLGTGLGVAGGGYFWAHYLIQLAAPIGVASGIALSRMRHRHAVAVVATLAVAGIAGQVVRADATPSRRLVGAGYRPTTQQSVLAIADFVRRNSSVDDRIVVLYARANVAYHAQRRPATSFAWSSMYRALPEARADLLQALEGTGRAEWIVAWQQPTAFGLDGDGRVRTAIRDGYRNVAVICGKPVLVRSDRSLPSTVLPIERCPEAGPELVLSGGPVTRALAPGAG